MNASGAFRSERQVTGLGVKRQVWASPMPATRRSLLRRKVTHEPQQLAGGLIVQLHGGRQINVAGEGAIP